MKIIISLVAIVLVMLLNSNIRLVSANYALVNGTTFDYIIVGGGSAGSIIATRLAQNGSSVLVIESGDGSTYQFGGNTIVGTKGTLDATGTYSPNRVLTKYDVPAYWSSAYITGDKWNIVGAGVAKILGGCAMHNGMVFQRGREADYDNWGVSEWAWNDLFHYFKLVENITDASLATSTNHGHNGKIQVGTRPLDSEGANFIQSCNASGLPFNPDFQTEPRDGCGYFQFNIDQRGIRSSPFHEYLARGVSSLSNLKVLTSAHVLRVLFTTVSGENHATGVELIFNNLKYVLHVNHEVVLTAGALNTPKILMLSGIGDSNYLATYSTQIPVVYSNLTGVGKNLQNHFLVFTIWSYINTNTRPNYYELFGQDLAYSTSGDGILGTPLFSVGAWLRPNATAVNYTENIMLAMPGVLGTTLPFPSLSIGVSISRPKPNNNHFVDLTNDTSGTLLDFQLRPTRLHFTLLNQQEDIDTLVRGVKESRRIMSYPPMSTAATAFAPGPTANDTEIENYVKANTIAHEHWSGTARMGSNTDPSAVVDNHLRVFGVRKLRVADASVFPTIPDSLVHATVMVVAEKCAYYIVNGL